MLILKMMCLRALYRPGRYLCKDIVSVIPKRGLAWRDRDAKKQYYESIAKSTAETEDAKIGLARKVAKVVKNDLQDKIQDKTIFLIFMDGVYWVDTFAEQNFKNIWIHFNPGVQHDYKLHPDVSVLHTVPLVSDLDKLEHPVDSNSMTHLYTDWSKESPVCVVAWLPAIRFFLRKMLPLLSKPELYFPYGRVPHYVITDNNHKMNRLLNDTVVLQTVSKIFFDLEILETLGEKMVVKITPKENIYTDIVDDPLDVGIVESMALTFSGNKFDRLIPYLEQYFPDVGPTLLKAGFTMYHTVDDLDPVKLPLLLKLIKTYPKYSNTMLNNFYKAEKRPLTGWRNTYRKKRYF